MTDRDLAPPKVSMVAKHPDPAPPERACRHRAHRVPQIPGPRPLARIVLPECAGREAWLEARQGGIGGSEVGALVGVSEYETPFSVWNTKIHGGKDLSGLAAVEWGHRLEDVVAEKTAEMVGLVSRPGGGLWASVQPDRGFLRVTPDRFACYPRKWRAIGVIECKTAGEDEGWESGSIAAGGRGTGAAPLAYQAQLQWQLGILGLNRGWLGCLVLGHARNFYVVECEFDAAWFAELREEATRFWHENVLGQEPPIHDLRHPKTEELMRYLHPTVVRPAVDLPDDAEEWLEGYRAAKDDVARAQARLDEIKNYFRMHVEDAAAGFIGDRKVVSYPEVTTSRISVERLRAEHPEIAAQVTEKSTHRRMTIRAPKK